MVVTMPPAAVLDAFAFAGQARKSARLGGGHINASFVVETDAPARYVLQRINELVFTAPEQLMTNLRHALAHLESKRGQPGGPKPLDPSVRARDALRLIPTRAGQPWHRDAEGGYWRAYAFIPDSRTILANPSPEQAWQGAAAFARFQAWLADYRGPTLVETIPRFHDTPHRFTHFDEALARDACGRASRCADTIAGYQAQRERARVLLDAAEAGEFPTHVVHNDAKLANVLFDASTDEALCVVDLDTLMPGLGLYDLGDLLRSASSRAPEDCLEPAQMVVEPALVEALVEGWFAGKAKAGLEPSEAERALAIEAGVVLTLECGVRFLTDYLAGDRYFNVEYDEHNLVRARAQLALASDLAARAPELCARLGAGGAR